MTAIRTRRYGIRVRDSEYEIIWINTIKNGYWRGIRLPDGVRTRGLIETLVDRFYTEDGAKNALTDLKKPSI